LRISSSTIIAIGVVEAFLELRKIGIYGGTFDPIHHAHLILARDALELFGLEKIIFVPAAISPFKDAPAAGGEIRLSMVKAAIEGEARFSVDDCELRRQPPSYTIDTIKEIRRREEDAEIYCLLGEDNVAGLPNWHRFSELEKMVQFAVRRVDISATDVRNRVALGRSIRYLVPSVVEEIIRQANLYREQVK
jgi:nicotinate-nucleotide adenylyltransferase